MKALVPQERKESSRSCAVWLSSGHGQIYVKREDRLLTVLFCTAIGWEVVWRSVFIGWRCTSLAFDCIKRVGPLLIEQELSLALFSFGSAQILDCSLVQDYFRIHSLDNFRYLVL